MRGGDRCVSIIRLRVTVWIWGNQMTRMFIAEHDADGDIAWVWHVDEGQRCPSAIWKEEDLSHPVDSIEFVGDTGDRINKWMEEHREELVRFLP